jgi:hypothetical protein
VSAVIAILLVISVAIFAFFVVYTLATLSLTAYSLFEEVQQKIERGDRRGTQGDAAGADLATAVRLPLRGGKDCRHRGRDGACSEGGSTAAQRCGLLRGVGRRAYHLRCQESAVAVPTVS